MQVGLETSRRFFSFEFFLGCLLFLYCWQVYTLWLHKKVRIKIFGIETAPLDSGWVFLVLPWESSNSYHNRHKCPINTGFLAAFLHVVPGEASWTGLLPSWKAPVPSEWKEVSEHQTRGGSSCCSSLPELVEVGQPLQQPLPLLRAYGVLDPLQTSFHLLSYSITTAILRGVI